MKLAFEIRRLGPEDWGLLRRARLDALRDAPEAFGEKYEDAFGLAVEDWRNRLINVNWWVAEYNETVASMAALKLRHSTNVYDLMSVWTRPEMRRLGLAEQVIQSAIPATTQQHGERVVLFVVADNMPARRMYEKAGFVATGKSKPIDNGGTEIEMAIDLTEPNHR
jgi:predicted GNAT family acetyltransferase